MSEHRVWKAHMKMALSNERTLISWIRVGATYGSGALVAATLANGQTERGTATELAGRFTLTIQALLGLAIVTWATVQFALRGRLLAARWHGSYENNVGPALFTVPQLCRKGPVWPASADQSADCPRLAEAWGSSWHGLALTGAFVEPAGRRRSQLVFDLLPGRQHPQPSAHGECLAPPHPRLLRLGLPLPPGPQSHGQRGAALLLPDIPRLCQPTQGHVQRQAR